MSDDDLHKKLFLRRTHKDIKPSNFISTDKFEADVVAQLGTFTLNDFNGNLSGKDIANLIAEMERKRLEEADATMDGLLPGLEVALAIELTAKGVFNRKKKIHLPPGYALSGILRFVLPKKMYERVIGQMIIDAREEYVEALDNGENWHAKWISVRLNLMVLIALMNKVCMMPVEKFAQLLQKE